VALVVVAIGVTAVIQSTTRSLSATGDLENATFARWIASNVISEYRIAGRWDLEDSEDERSFAQRTWPIRIQVTPSDVEQLQGRVRVIRVTVFDPANPAQSLRVVEGRLHKDEQAP